MLEERKDLMVDWLELPDHLLQLIANRIISLKDYVCFGAVCKLWFSTIFIHDIQERKHRPLVPVLMLSTNDDNEDEQTCSYYNLIEKRIYRDSLLVPHNRVVYNSSRGWLVTLQKVFVASLLNPFMSSSIENHEIDLPSLTTLETDNDSMGDGPLDLTKVALSANPLWDSSQCMAMAIYGSYRRVAYCKLGDIAWTHIDLLYSCMEDVMYYRNKFYFVHMRGSLFSYDPNDPHPMVTKVARRPEFHWDNGYVFYYIVESNGNLLLVLRAKKHPGDDDVYCNLTRHFFVFKLDLVELVWIEVKTLDGHTLFLGRNCSVSLSASDFSECRPNCIYYTNEHQEAFDDHIETFYYGKSNGGRYQPDPHDMGVFNLEDESFLQSYYLEEIHKLIPRPIWIEPTMQSC